MRLRGKGHLNFQKHVEQMPSCAMIFGAQVELFSGFRV